VIRTRSITQPLGLHNPREEFARDCGVTLEAVREALDHVANNLPLIKSERHREAADLRARGLDRPTQSCGP